MNNETKNLKILLIEDNPGDARLLSEMLKELPDNVFEVETVGLLALGLDYLKHNSVDTVIMDLGLPDSQGLDTFRKVCTENPKVPVLVMTGLDDETTGIQAVMEGAQDYLIKGTVDGKLLSRIVRFAIERKQAEKALQESEERYRRITMGLTDYQYTVMVKNGKVGEAKHNSACFVVTGYTEEELAADSYLWFNMIVPEDRDLVRKHVKEIILGNENKPIEHRIIRKDGEMRWVSNTAILHNDNRGKLISYDGIIKDITERRRTEEALQNVQKLESLGILAGGIAHDFNNLMAGVFGYIDLAIGISRDEKAIRYLSNAKSSIDRARSLTAQLLTFASGGAPIRKITSLFSFIQEIAQFALSGSNISCCFDIAENLWSCHVDKNQIGQVIDNIVINAQQAMPTGSTIEVTAKNISLGEKEHVLLPAGNYVKISIKDSGIGITKDILPRIFDPFYTTKAMGRGLGLATCYSIIRRHDGTIDVESEPGKGSTFHIYLPASAEAVVENAVPVVRHKGSGTIIVMDDEEVIRNVTADMLEILGYSAVCKPDGREALDFFIKETEAKRAIAGLIFDLTVPGGMGGIEAVAELRKLNTEIPVFVASGYAGDPVMKSPAEYGFTASICKPFTKADLAKVLETHLKKTT